MEARLRKWGNSLAIRIHKSVVDELGLGEGAVVELEIRDGELHLKPLRRYSLDALLKGVTKHNRHDEIDTGRAVGREAW